MTDPSVSITRAQLTCPYRLPEVQPGARPSFRAVPSWWGGYQLASRWT